MRDDLVSLYDYDAWANRRVFESCRKLTPEQYEAEPFPGALTIHWTIFHIARATEGWLRALTGDMTDILHSEEDLPTVDAAEKWLERAYGHGAILFARANDDPTWLDRPVTLVRRNMSATIPPWVVMRHVVNHATYHRGQIATKLKRLGVESTASDYVYWAMEKFRG